MLWFGAGGLLFLAGWPLVARGLGAAPNVAAPGARAGSDAGRALDAVRAMSPHLEVLVVAVPLALAGGVVLRRVREASGLANDLWAWGALAAGAVAVIAAYATGPGDVEFWLATSVHRTTFFPTLVAWWIVATWSVTGVGAVAAAAPTAAPAGVPAPVG